MKRTFAAAAFAIAALASTAAQATAITANGQWNEFFFAGVGSSFDQGYTFTLTESAVLRVTDAYLSGDQFEVFNFGTSLGVTSLPTLGDDVQNDFDGAYLNPNFSHGEWTLSAGTYSITGTVLLSPYNSGAAALSLSPVPEADALVLSLSGLALIGLLARRRIGR